MDNVKIGDPASQRIDLLRAYFGGLKQDDLLATQLQQDSSE
jgi:hypothetical protein